MSFTIPNADEVAYPAMARIYSSDILIQQRANEGWHNNSGGVISASSTAGKLSRTAGVLFAGTTEVGETASTTIPAVSDSAATTIASGSNNVHTNTFAGSQTINVASTTSFTSSGLLFLNKSSITNIIKYTGTTSTTFTGCTTLSGADITLATSDAISQCNSHETLPRWALIEVDNTGTATINLGTAATNPVPPTPTANRIIKCALYIPALASAVDALLSTANGNAKIVDKTIYIKARARSLGVNTGSYVTLTNPTTLTSGLNSTIAVPTLSLRGGDTIMFEVGLRMVNNVGSGSAVQINILMGSNVIVDYTTGTLTQSATGRGIYMHGSYVINGTGGSNSYTQASVLVTSLAGTIGSGSGETVTLTEREDQVESTNFSLAVDNDIDVKARFVTSSAGATIRLVSASFIKIPVQL